MLAEWLLIICLGDDPSKCNDRGGMAATRVTEIQCKAVLTLEPPIVGICISPEGEVFKQESDLAEQK